MSRYGFRVLCDADVEAFNRHFNRACWTHRRIRQYVRSPNENPLTRAFYAPAYVGYGIRFGAIWSIGSGFGRWDYILRDNVPDVAGKRVLVLGANNGFNAIQLLRSGAREVVAVEIDGAAIGQGEMLRELFEWADSRPLKLRFVKADMATLPAMDLGRFDLAIALCSLYYLDIEDMCRLTRHVSRIAPAFVLQANHAVGLKRRALETYAKSRIEFLDELLRTNGFEDTQIISYRGYPRPLVVGRRRSPKAAILEPDPDLGAGRDVSLPLERATLMG